MDVSDFIRRRREELREEAANVGLSPTDALLYWGEDSLVFEIVSAEMGESANPGMAMGFRTYLMERLLNYLRDGSLTGLCMTNDGLTQVRVPAERWFDYHVAASSGEHRELVGRHHSEARDRRWGSIGGPLIWTCPNRLTDGAFPAYSPFPEFSDMDGVVIRDPTGDLSPSEFDSPAQASDAIHPGLVVGHHSQVGNAVLSSREIDDGRYCAEMADLISTGTCSSPSNAARYVWKTHNGDIGVGSDPIRGLSEDAIVRRLQRKFPDFHPEFYVNGRFERRAQR